MVQLLGQPPLQHSCRHEVVEVKHEWEHVKAYIEPLNYGERFMLIHADIAG